MLASRPGLSQRATSFIASQCQGIHQMPLLRFITKPVEVPSHAGTNTPYARSKTRPSLPPPIKP